jgi:cell pole-organizing protein PopZ
MSNRRIDRLCRELLPAGFERVSRLAPEIQQFLEHNLPESVNRSVRLLTVGRDEIVIAAFTPMVASYLRMHAAEISQQLRETFALDLEVRFRTLPESLLDAVPRPQTSLPREVGAATAGIIERGAESVDDEQLREALRSLARTMKSVSKAEGAG